MGNPRIFRKAMLCKVEPTAFYGVDPVPVLASDPVRAIDIGDITKEYNSQLAKTHDVSTYITAIAGIKYATLNFKLYLTRTSAAATEHMLSKLLKACFWKGATINTFNTIGEPDATNSSVTIYLYNDGVLEKLTGARGTATFHLEAGTIPYVEFTMTGLYQSISDVACPTVDPTKYAEGEIFTLAAKTLTIGGSGNNYHSFVFEFTDGNTVNPIPSCTDPSGVYIIGIPKSDPKGSIHYLVDTTNAATIEALLDNATPTAIAFANATSLNLAIEFTASFTGRPIADVEGYKAWNLEFVITGGVSINLSKPS